MKKAKLEKIVIKQIDMECLYCGDKADYTFYCHEERIPICTKHYENELRVSIELWEGVYGSFCLICGKKVEQFIDRNESLPCLCIKHLAIAMRQDTKLALLVNSLIPTDQQIKEHDEKCALENI